MPARHTRTIAVPLSAAGHRVLNDFGRITISVLIEFPPDSFEDNVYPVALALRQDAPRGTLKLDGAPEAMVTSPGRLWIAGAANGASTSVVRELNVQTGRPLGASIPVVGSVSGLVVADGEVWVATGGFAAPARIFRISIATGRLVGQPINLGDMGWRPQITTGGGRVWVALSNGVVAISPSTGQASRPIGIGTASPPVGIAVTAANVWLAAQNSVLRIGVYQGKFYNQQINARSHAIAAEGDVVWNVNGPGTTTAARINASTGAIVGAVHVGSGASAIAIGNGSVWVVNTDSDTVSRIAENTGAVMGAPIRVGLEPSTIAVGDGIVWIGNGGSATITAIDAATGTVRDIGS